MLKIKDNVDLKELEKYGFEVFGKFARKIFWENFDGISLEEDTWLCIDNGVVWLIEQGAKESNERYFGNPQLDTLYDLIKDGLVEKVEE